MSEGLVVTGALLFCVAVVGERLVTNVVWLRDRISVGHKVFLGAVGLGLVVLGVWPLGSGSDSTAGPDSMSSPRVEHSVERDGSGESSEEGGESGPTPTPTPSEPAMPSAPDVVRSYDAGSATTYQDETSYGGGIAGDTTLWAREYGLTTEDGTLITPYAGDRRPQPSDCAAIPVRQWSAEVLTKRLGLGSAFCLFTEEERYGFIVIRNREVNTGGDLTLLEFTFQVWNGQQD